MQFFSSHWCAGIPIFSIKNIFESLLKDCVFHVWKVSVVHLVGHSKLECRESRLVSLRRNDPQSEINYINLKTSYLYWLSDY